MCRCGDVRGTQGPPGPRGPQGDQGVPAAGVGLVTIAGDADHTISDAELAKAIVKRTGAYTTNRNLLYPVPATDADSYTRIVQSATTGTGNTIVTTGIGATVSIPGGLSLNLIFEPGGVFPATTGA